MTQYRPYAEIDTPFGRISISVNGRDRLYVTTPFVNGHAGYITVNRVDHYLTLYLADYGDGFVQQQREDGHTDWSCLYLRRADWREAGQSSEASGAAYRKVQRDLIPLVAAWAKAHPEALAEAQIAKETEALHHLLYEREAAQRRLAELNQKIENQNRAVESAQERLADAMHRPVAATAGVA